MSFKSNPEINLQLEALKDKFDAMGQNLEHQLEGFAHSKPINYWDYIQVDSLLSLQNQRTLLPDEMVFIMYHQINELLFKMILWELEQVAYEQDLTTAFFSEKLNRISRYFDMLTSSFNIMREGMNMEQYLKFRRTLSPASGFQSAQYRYIEFASTELTNLIDARFRESFTATKASTIDYDEVFEHLYWQAAGKDFKTGEKTYTLKAFELKYKEDFIRFLKQYKTLNLWTRFKSLPLSDQKDATLLEAMRHYDYTVNIKWVLSHYRTALHYLNQGEEPLEATGGSDWVKYMHPKYQKRIFFPELWSEKERAEWGQNE
ncbi:MULTISPECIES: tryptophan 2,3-dioxygenase family protein [Leeuwenhoekiella]|uniref:tryptophan 2,3-dioxygenase family protein n=1 Tax=Leeuwenhoekiella TaxID=283735 RepID=UPI000C5153FD|nr:MULTISPECIES: tryptophan 2,3-dioxygenase family protein [Leeuwenhoekiella]MAO43970.1 tryptophan 2,3-dioxygenase [Leeuwenhoekiella sp.]HBT08535.1 tryptophan 2,3-dioxygenase [Leeuwenhoekiella sp.]HCW63857.1 tryptophan 2,3-dioxygenase [Leeuwenhoekiella sp.]|tara:strand:+ start:852 stop:1802 length:951 start_codon:yes stop_codon:yes gene_type:complete